MRSTIVALLTGILLVWMPLALVAEEPSGAPYDWKQTNQPERPWIHPYHQTLVMKILLAEKRENGGCTVHQTFEQALETIRRLDAITLGMPKIVYLTGWQHNGHDSKYPDWSVVNPRLKRAQDATATDSLKWLMAEGFKHHTTVSLHINMFDAYADSPLWEQYLASDVIAKDSAGQLIKGERQGHGSDAEAQSYYISYAKEWETGLAQKRIDGLLALLPISRAGTIHIDAFHTFSPIPHASRETFPNLPRSDKRISPHLGIPVEQEIAAQRRIFRYFRDKGVDVTCEGSTWLRQDPFIGLQPMAWRYSAPMKLDLPPSLYCGTPMRAEEEIRKDPQQLPGLIDQFCTKVVPWHYANHEATGKGDQPTRNGGTVCTPALWLERTLVAYSAKGCRGVSWKLPPDWKGVAQAEMSAITVDGPRKLADLAVADGAISLTLEAAKGVVIRAAGSHL